MRSASFLDSLYRHKGWANEELFAQVRTIDAAAQAEARHAAIRLRRTEPVRRERA